jgi:hypothetical protein
VDNWPRNIENSRYEVNPDLGGICGVFLSMDYPRRNVDKRGNWNDLSDNPVCEN